MMVNVIKQFLQYLGGESDEVPLQLPLQLGPVTAAIMRGLWWGLLLALIVVFCGQSSKFIYIDF